MGSRACRTGVFGRKGAQVRALGAALVPFLLLSCSADSNPAAPAANFSADPLSGPAHLAVQFTDASSPPGAATSWSWDFGDGSASTVRDPSHTYTAAGDFDVTLTVSGPGGSSSRTMPALIHVADPVAAADFGATPPAGSAPLAVQFSDASQSTVPILSRSWQFGDGGTSGDTNPVHVYGSTGTYDVTLVIATEAGDRLETKTGYVTVTQPSVPTNGSGGGTGNQTGTWNSRSYRVYVPSSYSSASPAPLVAAMHGYGDTYTNFYNLIVTTGWKTAADNLGFLLFVPAHRNPSRPSFLHLSGGSTLDMTATLAEMDDLYDCICRGAGASWNIETAAVMFIGFSEGGTFSDLAAWARGDRLRGAAPYAGYVSGKTFPAARDVPAYFVCGTTDPFYTDAPAAFQEWVDAGHPANHDWVTGVGHLFTGLCSSGPSPESVFSWLLAADGKPVVPAYP